MAYTYGTTTYAKDSSGNYIKYNSTYVYEIRLGYQVNSQDIATNKSNISLQLEVRSVNSQYKTYGYNQTTTIDGTALSAKTFDFRSTNTWQIFGTRTFDVTHNTDGTYSVSKSASFTTTASGSGRPKSGSSSVTVTLPTIPRYTTISSFTVSKRNETSLTFNWSTADTIDYVWYSTNNGSNWTGYDVADGTSGSFTVDSLSPNTTYQCKLRVRRKDSQLTTDSSVVSQTTNTIPTISLKSKTETTITMNWSIDNTADYISYSTDDGEHWAGMTSVNATSGTFTISKLSSNTSTNLSANTAYNIKFSIRRKATGTWYQTSKSTQTTYQYPYVSAVGSANLTIGNSQTLTLYNPLGRSVSVEMKKNSTSGTGFYSGTTSGTSITFTPTASTMYQSTNNALYSNVVYYCSYNDSGTGRVVGTKAGTVVISEASNKPTLSSNTFTDTNQTTIGLTGSPSKIVLNASTLQISVTIAGKNYASISTIKIEGSSRTVTAGGSGANLTGSATYPITNPTKSSFSIEATDSRGLTYSGTISIANANVVNYIPLTITGVARRNQPTDGKINISSSGKYFNGTFGNTPNTLTTTYNWRESGGSWQGEQPLTNTKGTGTHAEAQIQLTDKDYTKTFEIQFKAVDELNTVTSTVMVTKGQPIFWWDNDEFNVNGKLVIPKSNDTSSTGIFNDNGQIILQSYANNNTIFNAGGGGLYIGYRNTPNGINFLDGKASVNASTGMYMVGGVSLIDSGNNNNGYYIKYSDGTMIQWGEYDTGHKAFTTAYGSIYYDNTSHTINFPQTFVGDRPSISLVAYLSGGIGGANLGGMPSATFCTCYVYSMSSHTFSSNVKIYWSAKGKWK